MADGWEDYDFVLSLVGLGVGVHRLDDVVYYYRVREGSRDSSLDREAHIRCYERIFENHRQLFLDNIGFLFSRFYDLRHVASQQVHLEHRIQAGEYAVAQLTRVAEARDRQRRRVEAEAEGLRRQLAWPIPKLIKHRLGARRDRERGAAAAPVDLSAYDRWYRSHRRSPQELTGLETPARGPRFALRVLPGGDESAVRRTLESLIGQVYPDWTVRAEADAGLQDPRIEPGGADPAAGGRGGGYTAYLEPGVELEADALWEVANAIGRYGADLVYGDHDHVDQAGRYADPVFKPDFSPDTLLACNYVGTFFVAGDELVDDAGAATPADVYDLLLRATEKARMIYHLPRVMSHHPPPGADPARGEAERRAAQHALERRGVQGSVEVLSDTAVRRVRPRLDGRPGVSVLVPARAPGADLRDALGSLLGASGYPGMEVIVATPETEADSARSVLSTLDAGERAVSVGAFEGPWSWARAVNTAAGAAAGEHVLLLDPRVRMRAGTWVEDLLAHSQRPETGAVGVKLHYLHGAVCHGGVIVGVDGAFDFAHEGRPAADPGYCRRLACTQDLTAVSGACLMVKRFVYRQIGGMDEAYLGSGLHDVDFCLRLHEQGFLNLFVPHIEGEFRLERPGHLRDAVAGVADAADLDYFRARHHRSFTPGDAYYNPNFDRRSADFRLVP
jgi:GT2 family glycosyltransferase